MDEKVAPLTPAEVVAYKRDITMPGAVIAIFNELIACRYLDGRAVVRQDEVVTKMRELGMNVDDVYKNGWLDVEDIYRAAGWNVEYDKSGYNEGHPPTYTFERRDG